MRRRVTVLASILASVSIAACTGQPTRPTEPRIQGTYRAVAFAIVTPDTAFDQLSEKTSVKITLNSDQTTTGTFVVAELQTDLAGQWDTLADTLRLHTGTPTFLNRMSFVITRNQLSGELHLQDGTLKLRLAK